jgi:hypothetical protein
MNGFILVLPIKCGYLARTLEFIEEFLFWKGIQSVQTASGFHFPLCWTAVLVFGYLWIENMSKVNSLQKCSEL